jgi:CheY-like chemotaxis protein
MSGGGASRPYVSGQGIALAIPQLPSSETPVIVLTSLSQKNEEKLISEGAAAYFEKSALALDQNSDLLATTVETVLARKSIKKPLIQPVLAERRSSPPGQTGA